MAAGSRAWAGPGRDGGDGTRVAPVLSRRRSPGRPSRGGGPHGRGAGRRRRPGKEQEPRRAAGPGAWRSRAGAAGRGVIRPDYSSHGNK